MLLKIVNLFEEIKKRKEGVSPAIGAVFYLCHIAVYNHLAEMVWSSRVRLRWRVGGR